MYNAPLMDFTIEDSLIIEKSIEFFSDPEPCFIHRSAVITRLLCELEDYITQHGGEIEIKSASVPENICKLLSEIGDAEKAFLY